MRRYLLLLLFFPFFCNGQQLYRLTDNFSEGMRPNSNYKGKVVWTEKTGEVRQDGLSVMEIFCAEKGQIKQITKKDGFQNQEPQVSAHYIVWARVYLDGNGKSVREIWCYDGTSSKKISLDSTINIGSQTAGKHVAWLGRDLQLNKYDLYHYNGEKTEKLHLNITDLSGITHLLAEENLLIRADLPDGGKELLLYNLNDKTYTTIVQYKKPFTASMNISGNHVLYTLSYHWPNTYSNYYYLYKNGETTAITDIDTTTGIAHFDTTCIVWYHVEPGTKHLKFSVFREGRNYLIFEYPYTETYIHPELADLRFAFQHQEKDKFSQVYFFNGTVCKNISIPGHNNVFPVYSGSTVAWLVGYHSGSSDIYFYCNGDDETDCEPLKIINHELQKAYYNNSNKKVQIELAGSENEKYNVALFDLRGRLLYNATITLQEGENHHSFPAGDLQQSIYLLRMDNLSTPGKSFYKKLLILN